MWRSVLRWIGFQPSPTIPPDPQQELLRRSLLLVHRLHAIELRTWDARNATLARQAGDGPSDIIMVDLPPWWHEADDILRAAGWDVEA